MRLLFLPSSVFHFLLSNYTTLIKNSQNRELEAFLSVYCPDLWFENVDSKIKKRGVTEAYLLPFSLGSEVLLVLVLVVAGHLIVVAFSNSLLPRRLHTLHMPI